MKTNKLDTVSKDADRSLTFAHDGRDERDQDEDAHDVNEACHGDERCCAKIGGELVVRGQQQGAAGSLRMEFWVNDWMGDRLWSVWVWGV